MYTQLFILRNSILLGTAHKPHARPGGVLFSPQNYSIDFRKNPVSKFILVGETNIQVVEVLKYEQANYKYVK